MSRRKKPLIVDAPPGILEAGPAEFWEIKGGERFMVELTGAGPLVIVLDIPADDGAVFRGPAAVRLLRDLLRFVVAA